MKVFKDVFSSGELFTDECPYTEVHDIFYEMIEHVDDVDLSAFQQKCDSGFTGEKADDDEDNEVTYKAEARKDYSIVIYSDLQEFSFDLKNYKVHIKDYLKNLKGYLETHNPERVESFMQQAKKVFAEILIPNFSKYTFYTDSEYDTDNMVPIFVKEENGKGYFWFWKDGLKMEKY